MGCGQLSSTRSDDPVAIRGAIGNDLRPDREVRKG